MSPREGNVLHGIDVGSAEPVGPSAPMTSPGATADQMAPSLEAPRVMAVVARRPRLIRLPIGRWVHVQPVGTTGTGMLDLPADVDGAGWWDGSSRLGDRFGTILVAAYVDPLTEGLGPFASLLRACPGERVRVWGGGLRRTFEIRTRRLRRPSTRSPTSWLHSPLGPARLTLVTCAGPYDADRGGYQNLAVIVAFPISEVRLRH